MVFMMVTNDGKFWLI